jgi:hypothetical protein
VSSLLTTKETVVEIIEQGEQPKFTVGRIEQLSTRDSGPRRMTLAQEMHLKSIKESFALAVDAKYRAGQAEHGGNLFEMDTMDLIRNLKEEAIDLWTYACTLEDQLIEAEMSRPHHGA